MAEPVRVYVAVWDGAQMIPDEQFLADMGLTLDEFVEACGEDGAYHTVEFNDFDAETETAAKARALVPDAQAGLRVNPVLLQSARRQAFVKAWNGAPIAQARIGGKPLSPNVTDWLDAYVFQKLFPSVAQHPAFMRALEAKRAKLREQATPPQTPTP